jgi:hypothetical protein
LIVTDLLWGCICTFVPGEEKIYQLEIKSGNPPKISGKGGTSGKHRTKRAKRSGICGNQRNSHFISNWVFTKG